MAFIENEDAQTLNQQITSNGQASLYINRKQILCATYLKNDVALYKFIQQPEMMQKPLHMPINVKADAEKDEMGLVQYTMLDELPMMPMPLSSVPKMEIINQGAPTLEEGGHLTFDERKKNWYIRALPRASGERVDLYYVHLQTDKQLRSLSEVYTFVVHGRLPLPQKARKAMKKDNATTSFKARKFRGDKLLKRIPVGHYNLTKHEILYTETPMVVESDPSGLCTTPTNTEEKKRKREEEAAGPEDRGLSNADRAGAIEQIYPLFNFEPILPRK